GITMFVQQKMTPAAGDPRQAKMMLVMPFVFTFMFLNLPAGLALCWTVSAILQILQQWYMDRPGARPPREAWPGGGPGHGRRHDRGHRDAGRRRRARRRSAERSRRLRDRRRTGEVAGGDRRASHTHAASPAPA